MIGCMVFESIEYRQTDKQTFTNALMEDLPYFMFPWLHSIESPSFHRWCYCPITIKFKILLFYFPLSGNLKGILQLRIAEFQLTDIFWGYSTMGFTSLGTRTHQNPIKSRQWLSTSSWEIPPSVCFVPGGQVERVEALTPRPGNTIHFM
jgi:hypothetical protein